MTEVPPSKLGPYQDRTREFLVILLIPQWPDGGSGMSVGEENTGISQNTQQIRQWSGHCT